jgi:hypothetical protein
VACRRLARHPASLWVRVNAGEFSDVTVDNEGMVHPVAWPVPEGMSVTPDDPRRLPLHRRPAEWGGIPKCPPVWCIAERDLGPVLEFREDPTNRKNHGCIGPRERMSFERFKAALEATRQRWEIVIP